MISVADRSIVSDTSHNPDIYPNKGYSMDNQTLQRIKTFTFPLNAYAYMLVKESDATDVSYLHYGWFKDTSESISTAQARATQEFLSLVPAAPLRILEVGSGVGTTLSLLLKQGHDACGITPDGSQIGFMRDRYGGDFPVKQARFEDMVAPEQKFDVILFQESGQYIPLQNIFAGAAKWLRPGGQIIMCDEVLLGEADAGESLHSVRQMKAVALQHGFSLTQEIDYSSRAAPTVDRILTATRVHADDLRGLLNVSEEQIFALDASNKRYQSNYAAGKFGYVALVFTLTNINKA